MTNPADDYVEKFVEDVDRSKVFTASHVMIRPETIQLGKAGPRVALQRMKQAGISSVYVTHGNNKLYGIVTADAASEAAKNGVKDLDEIVDRDIPTVAPDVALIDLFEKIHNTSIPMAVTEDGYLKGIILRGAVLSALSRSEVKSNE